MLSHRIRPVSEILAPHVEHLWVVRGYLPARWRNMILPDGAMELIVNLGDPQKLCARDNPAKHTIFRQSWVSGERTTPIWSFVPQVLKAHAPGCNESEAHK